jgi:hypothetical protein
LYFVSITFATYNQKTTKYKVQSTKNKEAKTRTENHSEIPLPFSVFHGKLRKHSFSRRANSKLELSKLSPEATPCFEEFSAQRTLTIFWPRWVMKPVHSSEVLVPSMSRCLVSAQLSARASSPPLVRPQPAMLRDPEPARR